MPAGKEYSGVRVKHGWIEPMILWTAVVADSGDKKSPAFKRVKSLFGDTINAASVMNKVAWDNFHKNMALYNDNKRKKAARDNDNDDENGETVEKPQEPLNKMILTDDMTVEGLYELLINDTVCVLRDELSGWFHSQGQYKRNDADTPFWLECYENGMFSIKRKGRTLVIPRCNVNLSGTIQPMVLKKCLLKNEDNGMLQRFLITFPKERATVLNDIPKNNKVFDAVKNFINKMLGVIGDTFVENTNELILLELDHEAFCLFQSAHDRYGSEKVGMPTALKSFWSKQAGRIARIAGVLHAVRVFSREASDKQRIDAETMKAAITLADWYGNEARRIYPIIGCKSETEFDSDSREILNTIKQIGKNATKNSIYKRLRKYRDKDGREVLRDLLQKMVNDGMLVIVDGKAVNGKKTQYFEPSND